KKLTITHRLVLSLALALGVALGALSFGTAPVPQTPLLEDAAALRPESVHSDTVRDILGRLERHYHNRRLNDELSSELLDRYLRDLDPNHLYFMQADIDEFAVFRQTLDDQLRNGDVSAGFYIYNRYQKRVEEALGYLLARLDEGLDTLDLSSNDTVVVDRSNADWPRDEADKIDLWRKRLKDAVLTMRVNGDADNVIVERLQRRYAGQLKRLQQSTSEDVFQVYINSLTMSYDPHTNYHTPHVSENFTISMS